MIPVVSTVPSHITIDDKGVARIDGTRMKVIHIAIELLARGSSPEQMQEAWPHLTLAQIHSALSYYYDHKAEIDAQIARQEKEYDEILAKSRQEDSPLRKKLRDLGYIK